MCLQVKIQALSFSADESTLASLGGQDDNSLVRAADNMCCAAITAAGQPLTSSSILNRQNAGIMDRHSSRKNYRYCR